MGVFTNNAPRVSRRANSRVVSLVSTPAPLTGVAQRTPNTSRSQPYGAVRALTAAAQPINFNSSADVNKLAKRRQGDAWQAEAWEYYDAIGEIKYAFTLVASVMSRIRLYAGENADPAVPPKAANGDEPGGAAAIVALQRLDSAFGGQPGLLRDAALNLCVPGECYLVQRPGNPALGIEESWDIRSCDELQVMNDGTSYLVTRHDGDTSSREKLPRNAFAARIWRPHPRYSDEADSSMRGLLDACSELLLLNKTFRATARSRLNAGMLYLPDGLSVAATSDPDVVLEESLDGDDEGTFLSLDTEDTTDDDNFEEALSEAMSTPIADESSASSVVPLIVRGPADFADKIKLIKFERAFDPQLAERSDRVLDRIMQGIDVPKDVVTGLANVKYSNAIQIDESLYRSHIEPLALLICDALTVVYLRPAMRAAGVDEADLYKYVVWYDSSEVTTRPNRAEDSDVGYQKQLINADAWRREHGFTDEDAPDPTEVALRFLVEKGMATPELTEALLSVFAPDVMDHVRQASQASNPAPLPPDVANAIGGPPADGAPTDAAPPDAPLGATPPEPAASPDAVPRQPSPVAPSGTPPPGGAQPPVPPQPASPAQPARALDPESLV